MLEDLKLLTEAVDSNDNIIKHPKPFVLFGDFGESALTFSVYFWIRITTNFQRKKVESKLRFRIDELFKEAGIVIAYSQQDIHLDTHKPLELRMIEDGREIQLGS